jgi:hypothetical protein
MFRLVCLNNVTKRDIYSLKIITLHPCRGTFPFCSTTPHGCGKPEQTVLPPRTAAGSQNKLFYRLARLREHRTRRSTIPHVCGNAEQVVLPPRTAAGSQNKLFYRPARLRERRTNCSTLPHGCGNTFPLCSAFPQACKLQFQPKTKEFHR